MTLTDAQIDRYSRQIIVPRIGDRGQERILAARMLLVRDARDIEVPRRVAELLGMRRFEPGIILEGGAIDVNGQGAVLTTEQCLLNTNRNPALSRADVERYLADYGVGRHVIWLGEGIVGDDTDGHIDELARFVGPRTVVAAAALPSFPGAGGAPQLAGGAVATAEPAVPAQKPATRPLRGGHSRSEAVGLASKMRQVHQSCLCW